MAAATQIRIDQYMNTSYHPDREFIDGELREKNLGKNEHARLQILLGAWLENNESLWQVACFTEMRVQVSSTRVRIPDVLLTELKPQPDVLIDPPVLAVEILSPEDSLAETVRRTDDYFAMGVPAVWVIDPEKRTAQWRGASTEWKHSLRLEVPGTGIYVELEPLFARLDRTLAR